LSAVQEVQLNYGIPVIPIATLDDLLAYLQGVPEMVQYLQNTQSYRAKYGVKK